MATNKKGVESFFSTPFFICCGQTMARCYESRPAFAKRLTAHLYDTTIKATQPRSKIAVIVFSFG